MLSFEAMIVTHSRWKMTYVVLVSSSQFSLLFLSFIYKSTLLIKFSFPWTSNEILKEVWVISHKFKSLLQKLCKPCRFHLPFLCPCIRRRVSAFHPGCLRGLIRIIWRKSLGREQARYIILILGSFCVLKSNIQSTQPNPVDSSFKTCLWISVRLFISTPQC